MTYLRQIVWHIAPATVVFLILVGAQILFFSFVLTVFILISGGEEDIVGSNAVGESVKMLLYILLNAMIPCVLLFPIVSILDRLTRTRPGWLKVVLPFPFMLTSTILAVPILGYFFTDIPENINTFWLSIAEYLVIFLVVLAVTFALFLPYWYSIQIERFLVRSVRKIKL